MNNPTNSSWSHPLAEGLPATGEAIERLSHEIIDRQMAAMSLPEQFAPVVRRVIHATADVDFGSSMRFHPDSISRGVEAIRAGRTIFCDVRMVQAGMTRTNCPIVCMIADQRAAALAKASGCTRAAAAVEVFADELDGAIVVVGNAPTAIWKLLELYETRKIAPALVVGLPVGFVGASESKQALMESGLCYITNIGPRGGSPVAAAAVNAIAIMAGGNESETNFVEK